MGTINIRFSGEDLTNLQIGVEQINERLVEAGAPPVMTETTLVRKYVRELIAQVGSHVGVVAPPVSYVYFVQAGDSIKIGVTVDLGARISALQTSTPHKLKLLKAIAGGRPEEIELHKRFDHLRIRGEWFRAEAELVEYITMLDDGSIV